MKHPRCIAPFLAACSSYVELDNWWRCICIITPRPFVTLEVDDMVDAVAVVLVTLPQRYSVTEQNRTAQTRPAIPKRRE